MALHILEALENLNTIIDAETLDELEVTNDAHFLSHREDSEQYWVRPGPDRQTVDAIKETFRSVYQYLNDFYQKSQNDPKRLVEGFNSIMLLVGEAAKKFDRLGVIFRERITDSKEYNQLQDFYKNKVIETAFPPTTAAPEETLSWEEEVADELEEEIKEVAGSHLLDDIETVKKDHSYELFYLKNESGYFFYSPQLENSLKLACDFASYEGDDPLVQIKNWEDKSLQVLAKNILDFSKRPIKKFYREALQFKEAELPFLMNKALMALMMAANPRNLIRQFSKKGCHLYFSDFQSFLREALHHKDYQNFTLYSSGKEKSYLVAIRELIHSLCMALFTIGPDREEIHLILKGMLETEKEKEKKLSETLFSSYQKLKEKLEQHPHGPLLKALDLIREDEEERHHAFDPVFQGNLPERQFRFEMGEATRTVLRIPSPTAQRTIESADVIEEFKNVIGEGKEGLHFVFINLQDRTSWKEHARSQAIEEMGRYGQFSDNMTVVTLAKDTDFYHQLGEYVNLSEADEFIHQFLGHLQDESSGYYFPFQIKSALFPEWGEQLLKTIHKVFFRKKKELSQGDRLNFIEIAYSLILLKLMETIEGEMVGVTSKDALDLGGTTLVALVALLTVDGKSSWDRDRIHTILYGPTLLLRERPIHPERFERLYHMIALLEEKGSYWHAFEDLFKPATLSGKIQF